MYGTVPVPVTTYLLSFDVRMLVKKKGESGESGLGTYHIYVTIITNFWWLSMGFGWVAQ